MTGLRVVKDNILITSSYNLTLSEQRLLLLAIAESEGDLVRLKAVTVRASAYADTYGTALHSSYESLKDACKILFERRFSYEEIEKKEKVIKVRRWVQGVDYIESRGEVRLIFSDDVIPFLSELKARFTSYPLEEVADLSSVYAIRLYELARAWLSVGHTPTFPLSDFRETLGISDTEYTKMVNFKTRVLDFAIEQINERTDLQVIYTQHKEGRAIVGFSFEVAKKAPVIAAKTAKTSRTDTDTDKTAKAASRTDTDKTAIAPRTLTWSQADRLRGPGETTAKLEARLKLLGYVVKG